MCRMVVAMGEIEVNKLVEDLKEIAKGNNDIHEKNPQLGQFKHPDGWGLAYLDEQGKWQVYKSTRPIFEDESIAQLAQIKCRAVIIHARRATKGSKSLENTQPLHFNDTQGDFVFAHNGTIREDLTCDETYIREGDSDSVQWFNRIIANMHRGQEKYFSFDDYVAANFFLATPKKIVVGQKYKKDPKYYSMRVYKDERRTIISSEVLPMLKEAKWETLDNDTILELEY